MRRRLNFERPKAVGEDVANFRQRNRSDGAHRSQVREDALDVLGPREEREG